MPHYLLCRQYDVGYTIIGPLEQRQPLLTPAVNAIPFGDALVSLDNLAAWLEDGIQTILGYQSLKTRPRGTDRGVEAIHRMLETLH